MKWNLFGLLEHWIVYVWVISTTLAMRFFLFSFLLILEAHFIIITMMLLLVHFGFADSISQFPLQYGSRGFFWVLSNVSANTRYGILSSTQCEQTALCSTTHSVFRSLRFACMPDTHLVAEWILCVSLCGNNIVTVPQFHMFVAMYVCSNKYKSILLTCFIVTTVTVSWEQVIMNWGRFYMLPSGNMLPNVCSMPFKSLHLRSI